jgi:hypothetical protein
MKALRKLVRSVQKRVGRVLGNPPDLTGFFRRETIARVYLRGNGIEIGALHHPLKVSRWARVKYVDRLSVPDLREQYPELDSEDLVNVDILDDGESLRTSTSARG